MKTLPTPPPHPPTPPTRPPRLGGFHPWAGEAQTPVTALFAMGTWTLFYTLPPPPPLHRPPHLGPERVSLPDFTQDHVVGALFPSPAFPPDLGLTSSVTGVSGPDSCRPGGLGGGEQLPPHPVPWRLSFPPPPPRLSPVGKAVLTGWGLPFNYQALVTMGVTCCFF